jgi:hypothetical protein
LKAICEMRGAAALTALPNVASLMFPSTERLPSNCAWLKVLKVSKRNSRDLLSVSFVTLCKVMQVANYSQHRALAVAGLVLHHLLGDEQKQVSVF